MNKTFLYKNLSYFILKRGTQVIVSLEIDGETYTQRGDFFLFHIFFREPGGANACTLVHAVLSDGLMSLTGCISLARLQFSALCLNLTAYFSSRGLLPVTHLLDPTALTCCHPRLLITMWQLVKAHWVTRNEPKIHVICYITLIVQHYHSM